VPAASSPGNRRGPRPFRTPCGVYGRVPLLVPLLVPLPTSALERSVLQRRSSESCARAEIRDLGVITGYRSLAIAARSGKEREGAGRSGKERSHRGDTKIRKAPRTSYRLRDERLEAPRKAQFPVASLDRDRFHPRLLPGTRFPSVKRGKIKLEESASAGRLRVKYAALTRPEFASTCSRDL